MMVHYNWSDDNDNDIPWYSHHDLHDRRRASFANIDVDLKHELFLQSKTRSKATKKWYWTMSSKKTYGNGNGRCLAEEKAMWDWQLLLGACEQLRLVSKFLTTLTACSVHYAKSVGTGRCCVNNPSSHTTSQLRQVERAYFITFKTHKPTEQERDEHEVLRKTNSRVHPRPLKVAGTSNVWWCHSHIPPVTRTKRMTWNSWCDLDCCRSGCMSYPAKYRESTRKTD